MYKLVLQRLGLGILTLFAASVLIFIGTELLPGDLATAILQNTATPESIAKLRLDLGLIGPRSCDSSTGCSTRCAAISAFRSPMAATC